MANRRHVPYQMLVAATSPPTANTAYSPQATFTATSAVAFTLSVAESTTATKAVLPEKCARGVRLRHHRPGTMRDVSPRGKRMLCPHGSNNNKGHVRPAGIVPNANL